MPFIQIFEDNPKKDELKDEKINYEKENIP